jgi:hypothetical protein
MIFFGITFVVALAIAAIMHGLKKRPFDSSFIGRVIITWLIVMAAAVVLFLGFCFLALSGIHGPIN